MQNKPLLSICIPTYNREKYLEECLESIVHQQWFNQENIEIVISDNASIDNTKDLVYKYQKEYSNIKYHRNEKNIGAIKNIFYLPSYSRGEYVWLISDDDMFSNIALENMFSVIREKRPSFILCNFLGFWNGEKNASDKICTNGVTQEIMGMNRFFDFLAETPRDITSYLMLLSIFCFRKDLYEGNIQKLLDENGSKYMDILLQDNFIHARIIYIPFGNVQSIVVIEKDLVLCRWNNISWSFHFVVCRDLKRLIDNLHSLYKVNPVASRKMKKVYQYAIFSYIVMTHIRRYMPEFLYNFCVRIGRRILNKKKNTFK